MQPLVNRQIFKTSSDLGRRTIDLSETNKGAYYSAHTKRAATCIGVANETASITRSTENQKENPIPVKLQKFGSRK